MMMLSAILALLAAPASAAVLNATPATFAAQVKAAGPGDSISLAPGNYGDFTPAKPVNISGPADATFTGIKLYVKASGSTLSGVRVTPVPTLTSNTASSAVLVNGASDIRLVGLTLRFGPKPDGSGLTGRCVSVTGSTRVTIDGIDCSAAHRGVAVVKSSDVTIRNSDLHDLRSSPIVFSNVTGIAIENNDLRQSTLQGQGGVLCRANCDHGDFIHGWTAPGYRIVGVRIVGNRITQGTGTAMLGINLQDEAGTGFGDVAIEDNRIVNDNTLAITVGGVTGRIAGNICIAQGRVAAFRYPTINRWGGLPQPGLVIVGNLCGPGAYLKDYPDNTAFAPATLTELTN